MNTQPIRAFSFGGGVQSTACLVLAAQGKIDFPTFLFCNVGEDSENPDTLAYVREYAIPFAKANGIAFHELKRVWRDGRDWTLYQELMADNLFAGIPVRLGNGMPGMRSCTTKYKINVTAKWLKSRGASAEDVAVLGIGISLDEWQRMRSESGFAFYRIEYPLVDRRLDRAACHSIITSAGLPVPPKSSCYFCPFRTLSQWRDLRDSRPDLFERSVAIENRLNEKRERQGKDAVYMTDKLLPLRQAVGAHKQAAFEFEEPDTCESGFCMT